jgi:hypothetical protein
MVPDYLDYISNRRGYFIRRLKIHIVPALDNVLSDVGDFGEHIVRAVLDGTVFAPFTRCQWGPVCAVSSVDGPSRAEHTAAKRIVLQDNNFEGGDCLVGGVFPEEILIEPLPVSVFVLEGQVAEANGWADIRDDGAPVGKILIDLLTCHLNCGEQTSENGGTSRHRSKHSHRPYFPVQLTWIQTRPFERCMPSGG